MNLLSNLTYTPFNDFCIRVSRIQYGWMDLTVSSNNNSLSYSASYVSDPLNDLRAAAVYLIKKDTKYLEHHSVNRFGEYLYIFHDLEPTLVTWLFKVDGSQLTLLIWADMPSNFHILVEENFNDESIEVKLIDEPIVLPQELSFAIKGPIITFIKALVDTFEELNNLKKPEDDSEYALWGYNYHLEHLNILKECINTNSLS